MKSLNFNEYECIDEKDNSHIERILKASWEWVGSEQALVELIN